jgi:hypothetical protein
MIVQISDASAATYWKDVIALYRTSDDGVELWVDNFGNPNEAIITSTTYTINQWHHAAAVIRATNDRSVYLDGGGKVNGTTSITTPTLDRTLIGAMGPSDDLDKYMDGQISHIAIYNVALTDDEIALLAGGAFPFMIRPESLVAYWPLIDDDLDHTGNGYDMTAYNTPTYTAGHPADIDPYIKHILAHYKMNDNEASATIVDVFGNDATWSNISDGSDRNTNSSGDSVTDSVRGRALDTQDGTGYIEIPVGSGTPHDNAFFKKGSMIMTVKPQFNYNDATNQSLPTLYYDGSHYIGLWYAALSDLWRLRIRWNDTNYDLDSAAYSDNDSLQRYHKILIAWDADKDFALLAIDGQVNDSANVTAAPTSSHPVKFYFGAWQDRSEDFDGIIDEIKIFNEAILPYGAFFTDEQNDFANPHADIIFHADFEGANETARLTDKIASDVGTLVNQAQIVSGAALVGGYGFDSNGTDDGVWWDGASIFDMTGGSLSFWFNLQAHGGNDIMFAMNATDIGNGANSFDIRDVAGDGSISLRMNAQGSNLGTITMTNNIATGTWHHCRVTWTDLTSSSWTMKLFIDGVLEGSSTETTAMDGSFDHIILGRISKTETFGQNCFMDQVTITDNPNTPEIWTAFGKPIIMPLVNKR